MKEKSFHCVNVIEDEMHVLLKCPLYKSLRKKLTDEIRKLSISYEEFCDTDKLSYILSNPLIAKRVPKPVT